MTMRRVVTVLQHYEAVCEHLLPDGLEVSVPYAVFSEMQSAQTCAVRVAEELKEIVLRLEIAVCVNQLHVTAAAKQDHSHKTTY